jgi:hypothetical protein
MREMGEIGQSVIQNIRIVKKKQIKNKAEDTDKAYKVFDTEINAIEFGKATLCYRFNKRPKSEAAKVLKNLSSDELFKRMWGLSNKTPARNIPTIDGKWCVYWRPSLIEERKRNKTE